ncbi:MAG: 5-amino-6-(D-ribitylamino)uracil--L-tyrosine 4-hydroxyphenyl transferase CofH [Alphaproteobacteria bacterium]|nr:5-amino-6-(D-ribitylamino)uracil--L-tyrosine 4-hydroxyphenyl transferase CofH [Alphaproteobacteria bacterium]
MALTTDFASWRDQRRPERAEALALADAVDERDLELLLSAAAALRDQGHGRLISYSRKVFIPLTQLCRDVCHYCTFAHPPKRGQRAFMTPDEVLAVARAGAEAGCNEALFTLGDKPEARYRVAREELAELGHETTLSYLRAMALLVFEETGLLPHLNPGVMDEADLASLREVSVSQGIMLESISPRLMEKGACHHGSPDKDPAVRLATIEAAGRLAIPFTTGILIGIGETRVERIEAMLALRDLHDQYGHIQEIIVQNFRAKDDTRMADWPDAPLDELRWSIAVARLIFGPAMHIQAPPNLSPGATSSLIAAGIDDWGGVSPVTPDHVNPEAPWPHLRQLADDTARGGKHLVERLAIYPDFAQQAERWLDPAFVPTVLHRVDAAGLARTDTWSPGIDMSPPVAITALSPPSPELDRLLVRASAGEDLDEDEVTRLFMARGGEVDAVCQAADALRQKVNGDEASYVVVRNINYTNICYFKCQFCAFSKGKLSENLRGRPYDLSLDEIGRRVAEAWDRGATEVCMQGGIHPEYTGQTYLDILHAVKAAAPDMHVHAFSPLEVYQGAQTLGVSLRDFLEQLRAAGLGSLPGTAAEILDEEVRRILCPDKLTVDQWLEVMETAHDVGFRTTATIMFGHVDRPIHWARHLLHLRALQIRTGGFTELVPLPFVHMEAPIYLKGRARMGPTYREALLMHAVARLVLHPHISNIQTSWVKMGRDSIRAALNAGVNDLGGTLMNETITRAAGSEHGQELPPHAMEALIRDMGRTPVQRTTTYGTPPERQIQASFQAAPLEEIVNNPARKYERDSDRQPLIRPGLEASGGD